MLPPVATTRRHERQRHKYVHVLNTARLTPNTSTSATAMAGPMSALRPYQARVVDRAVELYGKGTRRLLVPLATGLGKTVVFTHLSQVRTHTPLHGCPLL